MTGVKPILKAVIGNCDWDTSVTGPSASVAVGSTQDTTALVKPGGRSTWKSLGQLLIIGGLLSVTPDVDDKMKNVNGKD